MPKNGVFVILTTLWSLIDRGWNNRGLEKASKINSQGGVEKSQKLIAKGGRKKSIFLTLVFAMETYAMTSVADFA